MGLFSLITMSFMSSAFRYYQTCVSFEWVETLTGSYYVH